MRKTQENMVKQSRRRRRAVIAAILLAGSPLLAGEPHLMRTLVPRADSSVERTSNIESNPFCQDVPRDQDLPIQLAAGESTSLKLKPIGAAVGLHSIDNPVKVNGPVVTIEAPPTSRVRNNPLVQSEHRENRELVVAEIVDRAATAESASSRPASSQKSTITLPKPKPETETTSTANTTNSNGSSSSSIVLVSPLPAVQTAEASLTSPLSPPVVSEAFADPVVVGETSERGRILSVPPPSTLHSDPDSRGESSTLGRRADATATTMSLSDDPTSPSSTVTLVTPKARPVVSEPQPNSPSQSLAETNQVVEANEAASGESVNFSLSDSLSESSVFTPPLPVNITELGADESESNELLDEPVVDRDFQPSNNVVVNQFAVDRGQIDSSPIDSSPIDSSPIDSSPTDSSPADSSPAESTQADESSPAVVRIADQEPDDRVPSTIDLDDVTPIVLDQHPSAAPLVPFEPVIEEQAAAAPIAIYRVDPVVRKPVATAEATLQRKRYRPPVDVTSVPVAFDRNAAMSIASDTPAVQSVEAMNLAESGKTRGKRVQLTPLHMGRTQVRSLTLGGKVRGVKVADKGVCQAFSAGPNQLKLIGTGNGVTQLVVWADAEGSNGQTKMRAFEIHVKDVVQSSGDSLTHKTAVLNESIVRAFPNCRVSVRPIRDQIVVSGRCDSEAAAKQIVRMVRKTCLVPVQDQLVVR